MTQRSINNTIRAVALGAAVAVASAACESTTEPTPQTSTPLSVYQLVLGTWVQDDAGGQPQYIQFAGDGTAAIWAEYESVTSQKDLDFDLNWEIKEEVPFDVVIEGFGVLTYDRGRDVLLGGNGSNYRRALLLSIQ